MSNHFKDFKSNLQNMGYTFPWKLIKEKDLVSNRQSLLLQQNLEFHDKLLRQTTQSICQNIDLIIPLKDRTSSQQIQLDQFLNILGTELNENDEIYYHPNSQESKQPKSDEMNYKNIKLNEDERQFRIQEFIKTEQSYVDTLNAMVKYVVKPLKANRNQKNSILNTFKCQKIFLNIDQIASINQEFLFDLLLKKESQFQNFGQICQLHIQKFECYRKYLLEQSEAQKLHAKEYKTNQSYKRFLSKVNEYTEFKRKRLQDILVEPVQRISRYSMMLKEILNLTPKDHSDYMGLSLACKKAKEIATMADDNPTKLATMFLNLYQSIKGSPCSLINQKRLLITHLDAIEINRFTNKHSRAVTLFLFTDKILVASKTSLDAKEIDLQDLLEPGPHKHQPLKFKGWADIESIELFEGLSQDSFILSASNISDKGLSNLTSFERYFYKGPRLFTVSLPKVKSFKKLYHHNRALNRKRDEAGDHLYQKNWQSITTYCNTFHLENYRACHYKNDGLIVYLDEGDEFDIQNLLVQPPLFHPWFIGLIKPEKLKGFRFQLYSKIQLPQPTHRKKEETIDFEHIFWNNIIYLNQQLRRSVEYSCQMVLKLQDNLSSYPPHQSISRASSISSLGKLFQPPPNPSPPNRTGSLSPSKGIQKSTSTQLKYTDHPISSVTCSFSTSAIPTRPNKKSQKDKKCNTISSLESNSTVSSFCLTDEEYPLTQHPLIKSNQLIKESSQLSIRYNNDLNCVFKSVHGFQDELQEEWNELITKFENGL